MWNYAVDLEELNAAVGKAIGALTGSEAGLVVNGAAGGTMLATAAVIAKCNSIHKHETVPFQATKNEFVILRSHWGQYSYLIENAGGKLKGAGYVNRASIEHVESSIGPETCGIIFVAGPGISSIGPSLEEIAETARSREISLFVSAAATLPPRSNLQKFIEQGADIVTASGGKYLGCTQTSGLLFGKRDLLERASSMMHPNHGIGRALKVSKEDIIAMYVALHDYCDEDEERQLANESDALAPYATRISNETDFVAEIKHDRFRHFYPCITIGFQHRPEIAALICSRLLTGKPRVFVRHFEDIAEIAIERSCCDHDDFEIAIDRLLHVLVDASIP
tara:strand:- start:501 stop:1508 length:1008 start_codon:yes stop_codon:yes gene_type:complete